MKPFTARDFACPKCGVRPQEACKLNSGGPRFQSHLERYDLAKDHQVRMELDHPNAAKKTVRAVIEESSEAQALS
jgi:hypothetical protein